MSQFNRDGLVGGDWNEWIMTFHPVGNFMIPTVTHSMIFQRGRAQTPTRKASDGSKLASSLLVTGITPGIGDQNSL